MLSVSGLAAFLVLAFFLRSLYLTLSGFWWGENGRIPSVYYRPDSTTCPAIVQACSTLTQRYKPPLLWGSSGHAQSIYTAIVGRPYVPDPQGERFSVPVPDGSTVTYNFYQPSEPSSPLVYLLCPGIGNCCESYYIRSFVHHLLQSGHTAAVLNHIGTPCDVPVTGSRLFTYGGTGDLAAVFQHLLSLHPHSHYVLVGFSLGANIAMRFIGERAEWRRHFVCAVSVCQGYDPNQTIGIFPSTSWMNRLYSHRIISQQLSLMRRHRSKIMGETPYNNLRDVTQRDNSVTHSGHDSNGFSLDINTMSLPNEKLVWAATSINELDEYYTRRVMGFQSVRDLWHWMSCVELMRSVTDFPLLLVNACDDPVIPQEVHSIPLQYTNINPHAMFVTTQHGGHLGFFEGGIINPHQTTWLEHLVLQYSIACHQLIPVTKRTT